MRGSETWKPAGLMARQHMNGAPAGVSTLLGQTCEGEGRVERGQGRVFSKTALAAV